MIGILTNSGRECYFQKEIFREAKSAGLILDKKAWFRFIALRNMIVHTYDEIKAEKVIEKFDDFSKILTELVENLKKLADAKS